MNNPSPFGSPYDRAGVDQADITDPWLHYLIQAGMVRPAAGPTLAEILKGELMDARVKANAAKIARGPRVPNALDPPKDILSGQNT